MADGTERSRTTYSDELYDGVGVIDQAIVVTHHDPQTGLAISSERHLFYGRASMDSVPSGSDFTRWKHGREYQTEFRDAAGTVLKRLQHNWLQRAPVLWWTGLAEDAPAT